VARREIEQLAGVGNAAVRARTGKGWDEWLALLDGIGAAEMTHAEIAALLAARHGVGPWWSQMITVGYEQARGRREKHERPDGYQVGASRTISAPLASLYTAWSDKRKRERWLPGAPLAIRKSSAGKSLRIAWRDGESRVDVNFTVKSSGKCQVAVEHGKLHNAREAALMKSYWGEALDRLRERLEKPGGRSGGDRGGSGRVGGGRAHGGPAGGTRAPRR
jgi:uncharacterized protein YndB with AHSA1/START domain